MIQARTCSRCGGRMGAGFIADAGAYDLKRVDSWIEGAPEKSSWTGLTIKGGRQLPVQTFRYQRCVLLESYAPEA